jgi:hypothetical protein
MRIYAAKKYWHIKTRCGARAGGRRERHEKTGALILRRAAKKSMRRILKKDCVIE